jgi:hypothetical protein
MKDFEIIKDLVSTEEYYQYLDHMIFHYATMEVSLEQALELKSYVDELVNALEENKGNNTSAELDKYLERSYREFSKEQEELMVDAVEEPTQDTSDVEFKVGDRVVVRPDGKTIDKQYWGTVILVHKDLHGDYNYLVELDNKKLGWVATIGLEGIACDNAWWADPETMVYMKDYLKKDIWYDCHNFTPEQLKEVLHIGTTIDVVVLDDSEITKDDLVGEFSCVSRVEDITTQDGQTVIEVNRGNCYRRYFRLT